jgi:hypothetical protein
LYRYGDFENWTKYKILREEYLFINQSRENQQWHDEIVDSGDALSIENGKRSNNGALRKS